MPRRTGRSDRKLHVSILARTSFFDLPVYRLSEKEYEAEFRQFLRRFPGASSDSVRREYLRRSFGGSWLFNEIVGHIRLHFVGSQVRGSLWIVDKKRIVKTRKKCVSCRTLKVAPEVDLPMHGNNAQFYDAIQRYIQRARESLPLLHIDTSVFDRIGPFIDWKALRED